MRRTAVGKTLIVLLAILVVTALSLSIAVASGKSASAPAAAAGNGGGGDGGSNGGPCPDSSHNPGGTPPNCGHGQDEPPVDTCNDGMDNDEDGLTDGDDPECQDPDDGVEDTPDVEPGTCEDGIDNDKDGLTDGDDPECQDPDDGDEDGSDQTEPTCADPDGDGIDHSAFDNDSNEGGLVSSIVHEIDQAIPSPLAGDQGVVTEVNCAIVVTVEELIGING